MLAQSEILGKSSQASCGLNPSNADLVEDVRFANMLKSGPIRMFTEVYDDVTLHGCDATEFPISNAVRIQRYFMALAVRLKPLEHRARVLAGYKALDRLRLIWAKRGYSGDTSCSQFVDCGLDSEVVDRR